MAIVINNVGKQKALEYFSGKTTTTKTQQEVNASSNAPTQITPQPNVLDKFGSYTYNASVYLMTPEQYQQMLQTKKKQIKL